MAAPFRTDLQTRRFFDRLRGELEDETARINAVREIRPIVLAVVERAKGMSLTGKLTALTERAQEFNRETGEKLDALSAKIDAVGQKRDGALAKHHAYYDGIEQGIDESAAVIDRLSNMPLGEGSGN